MVEFREDKRPQMQKNLKLTREKRKEIRSQINSLKEQETTLLQRIRKLQQQAEQEDTSYDKVETLQDNLKSLRANRESLKEEAQKLDESAASIQAQLESRQEQMQKMEERLKELRQDYGELNDQLSELIEKQDMVRKQEEYRSAMIRVHKRLTMAWSVLLFALVGMPLGMMARRHSIMLAFGASFAIVIFLFYPFLIGGQLLAETGDLPVTPAMWSGNMAIALIGLILMWAVFRR